MECLLHTCILCLAAGSCEGLSCCCYDWFEFTGRCLSYLNKTGNVRKSEARLCNHCYRGKEASVTYSECLSVALVIQHTNRMPRITICGLSGFTKFFHLISWTALFSGEKVIEYKMCVVIICTAFVRYSLSYTVCPIHFVRYISHSNKNSTRCYCKFAEVLMLVILVRAWTLNFLNRFTINRHKNATIGTRVIPCGWTDGRTDRRTDRQRGMTKILVAVRNFANDPKNDKPLIRFTVLYCAIILLHCQNNWLCSAWTVTESLWLPTDWVTSSDRNFCCYRRIRTSSGAKPAPLELFKWRSSSRKRQLVAAAIRCRFLYVMTELCCHYSYVIMVWWLDTELAW